MPNSLSRRVRVSGERQRTEAPISAASPVLLYEFFEQSARRWPTEIAIDVPPSSGRTRRTVTYVDLASRSAALARELREVVASECVVAILLPRTSEHIYLAQLAILRAGAAYVCLDPTFPDAQIAHILSDASPVAVLTDAAGGARLRAAGLGAALVIDVTAISTGGIQQPLAPADWLTPQSLAYLIYTSGTTGRPKGVMIEHAGIVNLVARDRTSFPAGPGVRMGQNSSCAYDSSVEEVWMAFSTGATLVVMDDETTRLGPDLVSWLHAERINVFSPPPTLLRSAGAVLVEGQLPDLQRLHVGGEPLTEDVARRWGSGRLLVNDYGPTECSVTSLRAIIGPDDPITIGKPVEGLRAWVLNEQLEEVAVGEAGELCLGGVGLARGYVNDPEMTVRKFPVLRRLGRIYRTGDLARRDANGVFTCEGRIDTQVKVRGYRIELEAIESRLSACPGVRQVACRVQGEGADRQIAAFLVPEDPATPPALEAIKDSLRRQLPEYMVPGLFGILERLPTTVSGKLDRRSLPTLDAVACPVREVVAARDALEARIVSAFGCALRLRNPASIEDDFFHDLGGDSLRAAMAISLLREGPATSALAVRDLYETRNAAGLAARVREKATAPAQEVTPIRAVLRESRQGRPLLVSVLQIAWLLVGLMVTGPILYFLIGDLFPELARTLGIPGLTLLAPLLAGVVGVVWTAVTGAFALAVKWTLIGRYRPGIHPAWGSFHLRHWIVTSAVRLLPWQALEGTVFTCTLLRWLGAKIGTRVHLHRGVDFLHGGWDLLQLGDDVTLDRDAAVRPVELHDGCFVLAPVVIGNGATVEPRAAMSGGATLGDNAVLTAHSHLPAGATVPAAECWSGVSASRVGAAPEPPSLTERPLRPWVQGVALLLGRAALRLSGLAILVVATLLAAWAFDISGEAVANWMQHPTLDVWGVLIAMGLLVLSVPADLIAKCLAMRSLGRVHAGVVSRWSLAYTRVWLKMEICEEVNNWLSGTLMFRTWLRAAGMKIGNNTEVSTLFDTVPELVSLGADTFFADGIYIGGPRVHGGVVTLAPNVVGPGVFLGNYAVVPAGRNLPEGVLLGVCTIAGENLPTGSSWFGLPPFELPRREVVALDPSLTHKPSRFRYVNRVVWELARFAVPVPPFLLWLAWFALVELGDEHYSWPVMAFGIVPALTLGVQVALATLALATKWLLLGRVKPATHALWSNWVSRWDFNYTAFHYWARGILGALEGTLSLNAYLRLLGAKIGHRVLLGDPLAVTVDPDMIELRDEATVTALFQAHTFEDRALKLDRVVVQKGATVEAGALLLYGADVGAGATVATNSVVMKHERLLPERCYAGNPTRPV